MNTKKVKNFWDAQAAAFGESQLATAPDTYYRSLEIERIMDYLRDGKSILDVGCGNGFSTFKFADKFPGSKFIGVDYSQDMIDLARSAQKKLAKPHKNLSFAVADVLTLSKNDELLGKKFDLIVSERCVINLSNWSEQKSAILEMKKMLKPGGRIILCENTQEGLTRLNDLRKVVDLPAIKVRWHNYYMPEKKFLEFAKKHFQVEEVKNIGSLYYIISRVVYAKLSALEKKEPDYLNPINEIAMKMPSLGDFSPNFIFVLRNK